MKIVCILDVRSFKINGDLHVRNRISRFLLRISNLYYITFQSVTQNFKVFSNSGKQHDSTLPFWPFALFIYPVPFCIASTQEILGFLGLKKTAGGWASLLWTVCLFTSRKLNQFSLWRHSLSFFSFSLHSSHSLNLYLTRKLNAFFLQSHPGTTKNLKQKKRRKKRKKGKDGKKKHFLHLYDMVWTINLPAINLLMYLPCFLSLYNRAFFWDFTMVIVLLVVPLVRLKYISATINGFAQWQMWQTGQTECL